MHDGSLRGLLNISVLQVSYIVLSMLHRIIHRLSSLLRIYHASVPTGSLITFFFNDNAQSQINSFFCNLLHSQISIELQYFGTGQKNKNSLGLNMCKKCLLTK
jgi:hypothetical protein